MLISHDWLTPVAGSFNGPWSVPMSADPNSLGERINNNFKVLYLPSDQIRGVWGIGK